MSEFPPAECIDREESLSRLAGSLCSTVGTIEFILSVRLSFTHLESESASFFDRLTDPTDPVQWIPPSGTSGCGTRSLVFSNTIGDPVFAAQSVFHPADVPDSVLGFLSAGRPLGESLVLSKTEHLRLQVSAGWVEADQTPELFRMDPPQAAPWRRYTIRIGGLDRCQVTEVFSPRFIGHLMVTNPSDQPTSDPQSQ